MSTRPRKPRPHDIAFEADGDGPRASAKKGAGADVTRESSLTFRPATRDDAAEIAEIWHRGWRDAHLGFVPCELVEARTEQSFRARAAERVSEATVAVAGGAIAGFVIVAGDEVEQLYVSASQRGTGVADELISLAERQVRANGHSQAWLAVVPGNVRARRFYERSGWRDEGPFEYAAAAESRPIQVLCRRYTKQL